MSWVLDHEATVLYCKYNLAEQRKRQDCFGRFLKGQSPWPRCGTGESKGHGEEQDLQLHFHLGETGFKCHE